MLLIGVLLGRGTDDSNQTPQVVTVSPETTNPTAAAGGGAPNASEETVGSEWPSGTDGWTVQLASLPKDGTTAADVDSIEQSISDQGVDDLGVLDADLYPSLPPGSYIVYSGVYDTRADAEAALKKLGSVFGTAQVVEVSGQAAASGAGISPATGAPEAEVK